MEAAAHGKSTLGIPAKVGKEFASADKHKGMSAMMHRRKMAKHAKEGKIGKGQMAHASFKTRAQQMAAEANED